MPTGVVSLRWQCSRMRLWRKGDIGLVTGLHTLFGLTGSLKKLVMGWMREDIGGKVLVGE